MSEFCSLTLNANSAIADSDCYCTNNKSDEREGEREIIQIARSTISSDIINLCV